MGKIIELKDLSQTNEVTTPSMMLIKNQALQNMLKNPPSSAEGLISGLTLTGAFIVIPLVIVMIARYGYEEFISMMRSRAELIIFSVVTLAKSIYLMFYLGTNLS